MGRRPMEIVQGTLDMLVLRAVEEGGPLHGYGIMRWIKECGSEDLVLEEGALYPALHRLEGRGWLAADWGLSENNRRAKFYHITSRGSTALREQAEAWSRYVALVARILEPA